VYIPGLFARDERSDLLGLIRDHGFAALVTVDGGVPFATHLPLLHVDDGSPHGMLIGHVARANSQWQHLARGEALAVFSGPHAYVSPSWYLSADQVPTWNYTVVHAYGTARLVDEARTLEILAAMVERYEAGSPAPWRIDQLSDGYAAKLARALVAFELPIARLEGKWKLGQNRLPADREAAAAALAERSPDEQAIAALMRRA
jgi:transcriptional regulator